MDKLHILDSLGRHELGSAAWQRDLIPSLAMVVSYMEVYQLTPCVSD